MLAIQLNQKAKDVMKKTVPTLFLILAFIVIAEFESKAQVTRTNYFTITNNTGALVKWLNTNFCPNRPGQLTWLGNSYNPYWGSIYQMPVVLRSHGTIDNIANGGTLQLMVICTDNSAYLDFDFSIIVQQTIWTTVGNENIPVNKSDIQENNAPLLFFTIQTASVNTSGPGICNGIASVSNISNGAPPYAYSWSLPGGTSSSISGLCANTYTVTVTDNCGNTESAQVVVGQNNSIPALSQWGLIICCVLLFGISTVSLLWRRSSKISV
jgi:hypothetical protein